MTERKKSRHIECQVTSKDGPVSQDTHQFRLTRGASGISLPLLPMSYPYTKSSYYVRSCYEDYYDKIILLMATTPFISLTGTPGIGKSIFYNYFFDKYREDNPAIPVVTISFDRTRSCLDCIRFEPGDFIGTVLKPRIPLNLMDCICLFDGPPSKLPRGAVAVCFTSPNSSHFDNVIKRTDHITLFFPLWTLDELLKARTVVGIVLHDDEIAERFDFFGGCPRYCLTEDRLFLLEGIAEINKSVARVTSLDDILRYLNFGSLSGEILGSAGNHVEDGALSRGDVSHKLFHYKPLKDMCFFHLHYASPDIERMIFENITKITREDEQLFLKRLEQVPAAASFRGTIIEKRFHEELEIHGLNAFVRSLTPNIPGIQIQIPPNHYERLPVNHPSIDGSYLDRPNNEFYLFQVTVSNRHLVKASGIIKHLTKLHIAPAVLNGVMKVRLVFVVPPGSALTRQRIQFRELSLESRVSNIIGVGFARQNDFKSLKIKTVQDLIDSMKTDPGLNSKYGVLVRDYKAEIGYETIWGTILQNLPQYVYKLPEQ